jgi:hypothetical protein
MSFLEVLLRYQSCDPATGRFNVPRNGRQFAVLLGVDPALLWRVYQGRTETSLVIAKALVRTFPQARDEVAAALLSGDPETDPALRAGVA